MDRRIELYPGVNLRTVESRKFKTGFLSMSFIQPLREDAAALNALLPSLPLRGTERHPDLRALSLSLDNLYGATVGTLIRKRGEAQITGWYLDFLEDCYAAEPVFPGVLSLLGEILFSPLLEDGGYRRAAFDGERVNLQNAIAAERNDKRAYALRQMLRTMCADEAYRISRNGDPGPLKTLTPQGLYAQMQTLLATAPIEIFYLGAQPSEHVAEAIKAMLAPLPARRPQPMPQTVHRSAPPRVREAGECQPLSQSKLCLGFRTAPWSTLRDLASQVVFCAVYGGTNGKLFRIVREAQSLCYYVSASFDRYKRIMVVSSGVSEESVEPAKAEILRQLEDCRTGQVTERELTTAKNLLISGLRTDRDSPARIEEFFLGQTVGGTDQTQDDWIEVISAVTVQDVTRAADGVQPDTFYCLRGTAK